MSANLIVPSLHVESYQIDLLTTTFTVFHNKKHTAYFQLPLSCSVLELAEQSQTMKCMSSQGAIQVNSEIRPRPQDGLSRGHLVQN